MKVVRSEDELRRSLGHENVLGNDIGLVPTMGSLHEGHLSLVRAARAASGTVVLSIFVNPLQFGPQEDLAGYPRDEHRDLALAEASGVDIVFLPAVEEMYPEGSSTAITLGELGTVLEGADRPGHFDGVATVVAKLFNQVEPRRAFFGQKDAQQVAVIRRMVLDLFFDIELVVEPTVREEDGLAMSTRNAYLTADERPRASALYRALLEGADKFRKEDDEAAAKSMWALLTQEGLEPSYATVVDPDTFGPPSRSGPALLVIAARLGTTRLIDNMLVTG